MAEIYVRSDGDDSNGLTWAKAKRDYQGGLTAAGAGGRVYVDDAFSELPASGKVYTHPGTAAAPVEVMSVDSGGNPEPPTALSPGAVIGTGDSAGAHCSLRGFAYIYGINFRVRENGSSPASLKVLDSLAAGFFTFDTCVLEIHTTSATAAIEFSYLSSSKDDHGALLVNTQVKFADAGQKIIPGCYVRWEGTENALLGTAPTVLFANNATGTAATVALVGVDLSAMGAGKAWVDLSSQNQQGHYTFDRCEAGSSVSFATNSPAGRAGSTIEVVNCDSADTNYRFYRETYAGSIFSETTIVRTGGASSGTTPISRRMVSSANAGWSNPLIYGTVGRSNATVGSSVTATVHVVTDNVTLNDDEAYLEVDYLGTSGVPLSSFASDRASDILATPSAQASSSESWTTTGLSTPVKQQFSVSFTPQEKGPIRFRVYLTKPSTTMYVCPEVEIS